MLRPGTASSDRPVGERAAWIAEHTTRWQAGWVFWFVVTTTFAWSFFALGRHLRPRPSWPALAVGVALLAAAVDLVGVVTNLAVVPRLADRGGGSAAFDAAQAFAHALTDVTAFGLYTAAGLLLLPALAGTPTAPRALRWLSVAEWGVSAVATPLVALGASGARAVAAAAFLLYAPWAWTGARWVLRAP